jgi:hypothetical protein
MTVAQPLRGLTGCRIRYQALLEKGESQVKIGDRERKLRPRYLCLIIVNSSVSASRLLVTFPSPFPHPR